MDMIYGAPTSVIYQLHSGQGHTVCLIFKQASMKLYIAMYSYIYW